MNTPRWPQWRYRFDNLMARGTPAMIGVIAAGMAVLVAANLLLHLLAELVGAAGSAGFGQLSWDAVLHSLSPAGVLGRESGPPWVRVAMVGLTVCGVLLLSLLVGVLAAGLNRRLDQLRKGRSMVVEQGHTVILGWSQHIHTVVAELVEANRNRNHGACVAILAAMDRTAMEDALRRHLPDSRNTRLVCRTGDPAGPADVTVVAPAAARAVVVLPPDEGESDIAVVKSLLAVTSGPLAGTTGTTDLTGREGPHLVAAVQNRGLLAAARIAGGPHCELVDAHGFVARLLVETSLQSGLSVVCTELLDFAGDELYIVEQSALVGADYAEAVHAHRTSSIVGLQDAEGHITLNPPHNTRIQPGEHLVALSEDDDTVLLSGTTPTIDTGAIAAGAPRSAEPPLCILVLGWNGYTAEVIREMDARVPAGSRVDVLAEFPDRLGDGARRETGELRSLAVEFRHGDTTSRELIEGLGLGEYTQVIVIGGEPGPDGPEADSRALVALLHLRDLAAAHGHRFTVTTEMADDGNRALAQAAHADDFIVSGNLLSLRLAQIAEKPRLNAVFDELFAAGGCRMALRPADEYVRPGTEVTFHTVAEAALRRAETAIGYRLLSGSRTPPRFGVTLNPDREHRVSLNPEDQIVVLTGPR